jgi:hypothetical protein
LLLFFLQTLLVFLFPLAVYCWLLGMINKRERPLMVSGRWDCVGLLFAASGFLLVVGPAILSGMYYRVLLDVPQRHQARPIHDIFWEFLMAYYWPIWLAYYVVMLAGVLLLLWWRGRKTIVYNVHPAVFNKVLADTLDRLGLGWTRHGNRLYLTSAGVRTASTETAFAPPNVVSPLANADPHQAGPEEAGHKAILDIEPFTAMCHVTLHWRSEPSAVRQEVETELERGLATVETEDNPAGTWLLGVATCLFGLMFVTVLVILLGAALGPRR